MSKMEFSAQDLAFFEEGDTLADSHPPVEDFSDLDDTVETPSGWVTRALAVLSLVSAR